MAIHLGIDIGGTFTDLVLLDTESKSVHFGKVLTTPDDPTIGFLEGACSVLAECGCTWNEVERIVHGTTLVTNAVIERKGVPTGLLTTYGFEDLLEIGREMRYDIYDLFIETPKPLIPRSMRKGVTQRTNARGEVVTPLDPDSVIRATRELCEKGAQAIAVCYLHAYAHPDHELHTLNIIKEIFPELAISLSSQVLPEIREFERFSATAMNAYVQPIVESYLSNVEKKLLQLGFAGNLQIMLSDGKLTTVEGAVATPVQLLESGPAGGCMASAEKAKQAALATVLSFDMGGTTAKAALLHNHLPDITHDFEAARVRRFHKGSGIPVKMPVIDMIEIGAGGGSIARVNRMGLLEVGPESAGASPGPACYQRGGKLPTVTDADLVLGFLNPEFFLGGRMQLSIDAARRAIEEHIAQPLGISTEEAAAGIHELVNENMAAAARVHALEKGKDPRAYSVFAFGGAGPVHGYGVAKILGTERILIPSGAGVASAIGFLTAPMAKTYGLTRVQLLDTCDWNEINELYQDHEEQARAFLVSTGIADHDIRIRRSVSMRYFGQGHEIDIPVTQSVLCPETQTSLSAAFDQRYQQLYKRLQPDIPKECVTWRLSAEGPELALGNPSLPKQSSSTVAASHRQVFWPEQRKWEKCPVLRRSTLMPGQTFTGPAIIEDRESTFIVSDQARISIDRHQNIIAERGRVEGTYE